MERTLKDNIDNSSSRQSNGSSQSRISRKNQLQLESKYKLMNDEIRRLKESGINSKEVTEKSKLLKKKLKLANELSKTAFDSGSQRCIEYDAEYFFNGSEVNHLVVKSLQVDSQAFDPLFFAEKLRTYIAPDTRIRDDTIDENELKIEDFVDLGKKCAYLTNSAPILNYLYGSFDPGEVIIPTKQRRVGIRNILADPKEEAKKPNSKEGIDESDDLKNGKEVERVYKELYDMYKKEKAPIQYFKSIVKPESFCDTVESIFYSAFLIKEGVLAAKESKISDDQYAAFIEPQDPEEIAKCQEKKRKSKSRNNNEHSDSEENSEDEDADEDEEDEESSSSHQSILSFCMNDWKAWTIN
ncbi:non-structural maintenance of chromosomes element 4 homolog A [Tetranychus urticae]|uniref:Non-structural maintenance of chromosomes element 4 n=1 Tax=Tetranychus urticae TaxID=32264 RepID=T1K101_TETUR|nr:non-structural maintenance of chromosomes element 4 homolog A [Tetranychus urticae]